MMSRTSRCSTAYSTDAATPVPSRGFSEYGGTKFPMFRTMKRSPGSPCVIVTGSTRASEQVRNSASGNCPCSASRRYSSRFALQYRFWNRWIPAISFRMEQIPPRRVFS